MPHVKTMVLTRKKVKRNMEGLLVTFYCQIRARTDNSVLLFPILCRPYYRFLGQSAAHYHRLIDLKSIWLSVNPRLPYFTKYPLTEKLKIYSWL